MYIYVKILRNIDFDSADHRPDLFPRQFWCLRKVNGRNLQQYTGGENSIVNS